MTAFLSGSDVAWNDELLEAYTCGVLSAGDPYFGFLFGTAAAAQRVLLEWSARASSEVAAERARVIVRSGVIAAVYVALQAEVLHKARKADLMALLAGRSIDRSSLLARLQATRYLFAVPEAGEVYLSKLWVAPAFRSDGLGSAAMVDLHTHALSQGAHSVCLDVSAGNTSAMRLYAAHGYAAVGTQRCDAGLTYITMRRASQPVE